MFETTEVTILDQDLTVVVDDDGDLEILYRDEADFTVIPVVVGVQGPQGEQGVPGESGAAERIVREVTAAGDVTVDEEDDDIIFINKTVGEATGVTLPASADRNPSRPIKIVDGKLDSSTNAITITPDGSETIVGLTEYVINFDGGSVELWPRPDETGWYI